MNSLVEQAVKHSPSGVFTMAEAALWHGGTRASLRVALSRAIADGDLVNVRRGLYCLSRELAPRLPHPYVLANLIYGPSYVSMETALEFHGWIPEAVQSVFCVTSARGRAFDTPLGAFRYFSSRQSPLLAGVERHDDHEFGTFFVASPLKALCDIVAARRLAWTSCEPVIASLRVDEDALQALEPAQFARLGHVYHGKRVAAFLDGLQRSMGK